LKSALPKGTALALLTSSPACSEYYQQPEVIDAAVLWVLNNPVVPH
jgi:hypothetical protein